MRRADYNQDFPPSEALIACNEFELSLGKMLFQEDYSASIKTYDIVRHLIARGEDLRLAADPSYQKAISSLKEFGRYHRSLIAGYVGERRAYRSVKHAAKAFHHLVNIELDYEGEHNEYDQILITPQCVVIIEVKNYSSSSTIGSDGIIRFRDGEETYNVGERMASKKYSLAGTIDEALHRDTEENAIRCLLLNANDKTFMKDCFGEVPVHSTGSISYALDRLSSEKPLFTEAEMEALKNAIEMQHCPLEIKPDVDFERIENDLSKAVSLIEEAAQRADLEESPQIQEQTHPHPREPISRKSYSAPIVIAVAISSMALGFAGGFAARRIA